MTELQNSEGVTYYVFQVSPTQLMTLVQYGPCNPTDVVLSSDLAAAGFCVHGVLEKIWTSRFFVELWWCS